MIAQVFLLLLWKILACFSTCSLKFQQLTKCLIQTNFGIIVVQLESESGQSNCFYLQPSYDIVHLLQKESWHDPSKDSKLVGFTRSHYENSGDDKFSLQWKSANQFYFQNLAVMKQLREICLKFHNDFTLEQVWDLLSLLAN